MKANRFIFTIITLLIVTHIWAQHGEVSNDEISFSYQISGGQNIQESPLPESAIEMYRTQQHAIIKQYTGTIEPGATITASAASNTTEAYNKMSVSIRGSSANPIPSANDGTSSTQEAIDNPVSCQHSYRVQDNDKTVTLEIRYETYPKDEMTARRLAILKVFYTVTEAVVPNDGEEVVAPDTMEVITPASAEEGETPIESSTDIPDWIFEVGGFIFSLLGGAAVGGGGAAIIKKVTKKDDKPANTIMPPPIPPKPPVKTTEKKNAEPEAGVLRLVLYKDFGDTLYVGTSPKTVGARIVELMPDGRKIDRADLTAHIQISEGEEIHIVSRSMMGPYASAKVEARKQQEGITQTKGTIIFSFQGRGGILRQTVIFNILDDAQILFFQENLTLPAVYDKVSRLPFVVMNMSEDVEVKVSMDHENMYEVTIERDEKVKMLYYAVITEKMKTRDLPGKYESNTLRVVAKEKDKDGRTIEDTMPVYRFHMGLVFQAQASVGCYLETYDVAKHPHSLMIQGDTQRYAPSLSRLTFSILSWDEEHHCLVRAVPDLTKKENYRFYAKPLPPEEDEDSTNYLSRGTYEMTDQEVIDKLHISFMVDRILSDNSVLANIYSCCFLDPPARRKVKLHMEVNYQGETLEAEQVVWLISQAPRIMKNEEMADTQKADEAITDNLYHIRKYIIDHHLLTRIAPVYKLAGMLIDGYDFKFGYDAGLVYTVRETFLRFLRGQTLGANATPEGVQELGLAAEIMQALAASSEQTERWLENHGGVWTRLGLGVVTLGWSEVGMTVMQVPKDMIDAVNNPVKPGGCWDAFFAGVKTVAVDFASEQAWGATFKQSAIYLKNTNPDLLENITLATESVAGKAKNSLGALGKDVNEVFGDLKKYASESMGRQTQSSIKSTQTAMRSIDAEVRAEILDFRRSAQWTPDELEAQAKFRADNIDALKKVKELDHATVEYRRYPSPETKAAFDIARHRVQCDKLAQKQMEIYTGQNAHLVRSEFYKGNQADYRAADQLTKEKLVVELRKQGKNVTVDDIIIDSTSNKDPVDLIMGNRMTRDRDLTVLLDEKPTKSNPHPLPKELEQDMAEKAYYDSYKEVTGVDAKQADQSVVQMESKERIGAGKQDVDRAFKPEKFSEEFDDVQGVSDAFEHKGKEWIESGKARGAYGDIEEGIRQMIKLDGDSLQPRATFRNKIDLLTREEKKLLRAIGYEEVKCSDALAMDPVELEKFLKTRYSRSLTDVAAKLKELVLRLEKEVPIYS